MNNNVVRSLTFALIGILVLVSPAFIRGAQAVSETQAELQSVVNISGTISVDTTWTADNIYYITADTTVAAGVTLTIEGGTIVKFWVPYDPSIQPLTGLLVNGNLRFTGTTPDNLVTFTSGRDDSDGNDTNGDRDQTKPARGDWDYVRLTKWTTTDPSYRYAQVRYSYSGLNFHNSTTTNHAPVFEDILFVDNICGLTLSLDNNGSILGTARNNIFTQNKFGFCTRRTAGNGQVNPTLETNDFNNNSYLPIYLYGSSFPTYVNNTFSGYLDPGYRLGIGLGGVFNTSGTLAIVDDMPFVLVTPMEVTGTGTTLTVPGGAVFKGTTKTELAKPTDPLPGLKVYLNAGITLQSNDLNPIIFTSYRDDSVGGDTNGDEISTEPYAGDWSGFHFVDTQTPGSTNFLFEYLEFRYAVNGFVYETTTTAVGARMPTVQYSAFHGNINGLRFKAVSDNINSRIEPIIRNCSFTAHGIIPMNNTQVEPGVPVMLENTVQPTYENNTFSGNLHPAIGLIGRWRSTVTLTQVAGQGLDPLPFLVHGEWWFGNTFASGSIDTIPTLTIPGNTVIKFFVYQYNRNVRSSFLASGRLDLQSTAAAPIVFTSYFDSTYGGDTDSDPAIGPAPKDWLDIYLRHPDSRIHDAVFRYGVNALHVESKSTEAGMGFDADIVDSRFEYNDTGLLLDIQSTNDITSLISRNVFYRNAVGWGTFAKNTLNSSTKVTGVSEPVVRANVFQENTLFPIYLNGSASLKFFDTSTDTQYANVFIDNDHTAVALGGYFGAVRADPAFNIVLPIIFEGPLSPAHDILVPYVVYQTTWFDWYTPAWIARGLVFKFDANRSLYFYGRLTVDPYHIEENTFTSYRDDSVAGDTNGTPIPNPPPVRGDWGGLYLANISNSPFNHSTFKYAKDGLIIYQFYPNPAPGNITYNITQNTFTENINGMTFLLESDYNITSLVSDNNFNHNDYGIHVRTSSPAIFPHCGTANPTLAANDFSNHAQFPLFLDGSSNPTYIDNNFWDNTHPAIAVGGSWCQDATWTQVYDITTSQMMPYVVKTNVIQELCTSTPMVTPTITLPANLIVKFMTGTNIYAFGYLNLESGPGTEIIFTAYADDLWAGDINNDGATTPPRDAWKSVWLVDVPGKFNTIHDARFFYATAGVGIFYTGPENTQIVSVVRDTQFKNSLSGVLMVIGWNRVNNVWSYAKGNIHAELKNLAISDSSYGILTMAHDQATGIINPSLENITFSNIAYYPVFLGGTSEFSYVSGITAVQSTAQAGMLAAEGAVGLDSSPAAEMVVEGLDLPGNQAMLENIELGTAPLQTTGIMQANIATVPDYYPAIGMAGAWNNAVTLTHIPGVPYAVTGNFPITVSIYGIPLDYKPAPSVTIGAASPQTSSLAVPPGTTFKFGPTLSLTAKGTLNLLSTESLPVVFTSIKDDSAEGDTNRDGTLTRPAKGDWAELQLAATNTFNYGVVRFANKGLHIYFDGPTNMNNASTVTNSTFMENNNGVSLTAKDNGDVVSSISNSTFIKNTYHMLGYVSDALKTGHLCIEAHNNDLLGLKATQAGILNNNINGPSPSDVPCDDDIAFDATDNYWGDPSGPYHPTANTAGLGSTVSDRVKFDPWLQTPNKPPKTYTIGGRITKDTEDGNGLPGVIVQLSGPKNLSTITDSQGYYSFNGLGDGSYTISPGLVGYSFLPSTVGVSLEGFDSTSNNFVGIPSTGDVTFSVNSVTSLRPLTALPKTYCTFTVSIDKRPTTGKTSKVSYYTYPGSALENVDYVPKSTSTLTFTDSGSLTQTVNIELKMTPLLDPEKTFFLILKDPINGYLGVSSGSCTILTTHTVYLPTIKK